MVFAIQLEDWMGFQKLEMREKELSKLGREWVIVCGLESMMCIQQIFNLNMKKKRIVATSASLQEDQCGSKYDPWVKCLSEKSIIGPQNLRVPGLSG